jgi:hypothetical protein
MVSTMAIMARVFLMRCLLREWNRGGEGSRSYQKEKAESDCR